MTPPVVIPPVVTPPLMTTAADPTLIGCRIRVTGTVQGVGFRPFVYRHAVRLGLAGSVRNDAAGVLIEVQGAPEAIAEMCRVLAAEPPPLALVTGVETTQIPEIPAMARRHGFCIAETADDGAPDVPVSVDTGTCADCRAEVADRGNRRFGYPFTNCTNCGPRYTIVVSVPYDRPATTMAGFVMCADCQREYDDPGDRRFHAQPNACSRCGPRLSYLAPDGALRSDGDDALGDAVGQLLSGAVIALKGVGGFHLAADATNAEAVSELRRRKARDDKPFALMAPDLSSALELVELSGPAQAVLASPRRPIVLGRRRVAEAELGARVAPGVAPGLVELGVMLPYTPLHDLVMAGVGRTLVLTSGNLSDDPIAFTDDDAVARLGPMVDGILTNDRPIHIRCDDSVVRDAGDHVQMLRRSRGFAPEPIALGFRRPPPGARRRRRAQEHRGRGQGRHGCRQPSHRRPGAPGHLPVVSPGHRPSLSPVRRRPRAGRPRHAPRVSVHQAGPGDGAAHRWPSNTTTPMWRPAWSTTATRGRFSASPSTASGSAPMARCGGASS